MYPSSSPEQPFIDFCRKYLEKRSSVLLCVSGGADSVALLFLFASLSKQLNLGKLYVAHVNHGLRAGESDQDENYVREVAGELGLDFFCKRLGNRRDASGSLEEWARNQRYEYFHHLKSKYKITYIATAHTADDQAETVLMRLFRGAGLRGMRGILPVREDGVVRPLLEVKRCQLLEWLDKRGVSFRFDSSNLDLSFRRNWVRHAVLPVIKKEESEVVDNLSFFAERMRGFSKMLEMEINKWLSFHVIKSINHLIIIKKDGFKELFLATEAMMELFRREGIPVIRRHIQSVVKAGVQREAGGGFLLASGWCVTNKKMELFLHRAESSDVDFFCTLDRTGEIYCDKAAVKFVVLGFKEPEGIMPGDNKTVWLDVTEQDLPLVFRSVNDKDQFWPLGGKGPLPVKQFLSKQKIPKLQRDSSGVVTTAGGEVVWIPGLRISHRFRVKEGNRRVFVISYQPSY